jgi:hypothetical protein
MIDPVATITPLLLTFQALPTCELFMLTANEVYEPITFGIS